MSEESKMRTVTFTDAEAKRLRTVIKTWLGEIEPMKKGADPGLLKALTNEIVLLRQADKKLRKPKTTN